MLAERFSLPVAKPIDRQLILGATLFGLGWGTAGICPGPAITTEAWNPSVLAFTAALFAGVAIHEFGAARFTHSSALVEANAGVWDNRSAAGKTD